ncbi:hypothetical protein [Laribacter hongkongensis]|uniref:hypothetical protein n=1 Tax=Laribacter hongkongensis TaxID=168471 RepID=UPI001EFEE245|nr:hypothetical protein [Laribacter hongkongensis]MCG9083923.1 hypothetical protein [Laribacter hongkongensis]
MLLLDADRELWRGRQVGYLIFDFAQNTPRASDKELTVLAFILFYRVKVVNLWSVSELIRKLCL